MNEVLKTCTLTMSEGSRSVISLPESDCGHTPYDKPGGAMIKTCGPEAVRANLSPRQAKERGLLTSGTFGQHSSISSASAALTQSLASKLKDQLSTLGSTLYKLIWKVLVTPQGRSVPLLRASVRRTSGQGSIGQDAGTTTCVSSVAIGSMSPLLEPTGARTAVATGWVTPTTRDWKDTPGMAVTAGSRVRLDQLPRQAFQWLGWATPTSTDAIRGVKPPRPQDSGIPLTQQVGQMDFGRMSTGYPSEMPSCARLNPELSRWLMGVPREWAICAPTETQ